MEHNPKMSVGDILSLAWLPEPWRVPITVAAALCLALGLAVVRASNATAYASDDVAACLNCHVMTNAHGTWMRGSHGRVAGCNDCHVPHGNPVATYAFKARDGLRHSTVFTLRTEPQALRLSDGAVPVVQENCVRCHGNQLSMIRLAGFTERTCWSCHENIHGDARSLSSSPFVRRPALPPAGLLPHASPKGGSR